MKKTLLESVYSQVQWLTRKKQEAKLKSQREEREAVMVILAEEEAR